MTSSLHAVAPTPPLTWRELTADDLDAVDALNRLAIGPVVRPDIVKPEDRPYFETIVGGRGSFIGVFDGDQLVGYGILQHDHSPHDDPREALGLSADVPVGRLAGARVAPAYRGRRLQRALIAARVAMAPPGMVLFSTAAPVNTPSWSSLVGEGFPVRDIVARYGGFARYFLVRDGSTYDPANSIVIDPLDTAAQKALFNKGWRGYARDRLRNGAPGIVFAPPAEQGIV